MDALVNKKLKWRVIFVICLVSFLAFFSQRIYSQIYPKRLIAQLEEIRKAGQELVDFNSQLTNTTRKCECRNAEIICHQRPIPLWWEVDSGCFPLVYPPFGEICPKEIKEKMSQLEGEIRKRYDQFSFLETLLEKEMEWGLESQLQEMDPEDAQKIREGLKKISSSTKEILNLTQRNLKNVSPQSLNASWCIKTACNATDFLPVNELITCWGPKEKRLNLKLSAEVVFDDLNLGRVGLKAINLNLPERIDLARVVEIPPFTIPLGEIIIDFRELKELNLRGAPKSISFSAPSLPTPKFPYINFSFPSFTPPSLKLSLPPINLSNYSVRGPELNIGIDLGKVPALNFICRFLEILRVSCEIKIIHIKAPGIYFEDISFPEINLCDLSQCSFPGYDFTLGFPTFHIPKIDPISITLEPIQFNGKLYYFEVYFNEIKFPSIRLRYNQPFDWSRLISPEWAIPNPSLIRVNFTARGRVDLPDVNEIINYIIDEIKKFILETINIPKEGCIGLEGTSIGSFSLIMPDIRFSVPGFPEIPEIPYCKKINEFCGDLNSKLTKVFEKIREVQEKIQGVISREIQQRLDDIAQEVNEKIQREIQSELEERAREIREEIVRHLQNYEGRDLSEIPPLRIPLEPIKFNEPINLTDLGFPQEIPLHWPDELKRINLEAENIGYDLPKIPLSKLNRRREKEIKLLSHIVYEFEGLTNETRVVNCRYNPPLGVPPSVNDIALTTEKIKNEFTSTTQVISTILDILQ
jgi:hypothetical protein